MKVRKKVHDRGESVNINNSFKVSSRTVKSGNNDPILIRTMGQYFFFFKGQLTARIPWSRSPVSRLRILDPHLHANPSVSPTGVRDPT